MTAGLWFLLFCGGVRQIMAILAEINIFFERAVEYPFRVFALDPKIMQAGVAKPIPLLR
jgi:hypothetical protein